MSSPSGVPSADPSPFLASTLVANGSATPPSTTPEPSGPAPATRPEPDPRGTAPAPLPAPAARRSPGPHANAAPARRPGGRFARPRPEAVTAAVVLWIVLGAGLLVWAAALAWSGTAVAGFPPVAGAPVGVTAAALAVAGAGIVGLAAAVLQGSEAARIALTVLGAVTSVAGLPLALVVPAVVLHLHPSVGPWLADAARRRAQLTH